MNKTPLSDLLPILSHRHSVNIYCKKSPVAEKLLVAAFAFSLSSAYTSSVFSKINPVPSFFYLKSFLWKGRLTVKVSKKNID